jgi:hypothetical protein
MRVGQGFGLEGKHTETRNCDFQRGVCDNHLAD